MLQATAQKMSKKIPLNTQPASHQSSQEVKKFIKDLCLIRGDKITLASGKQSDVYFNMKRLAADPRAMRLVARIFLEYIGEHSDVRYIGGLEMGAVPLTAAILAQPEAVQSRLRGFYIRKETKGHGLKKLIEGLANERELKGQKIILLEDVTTTGNSSLDAVRVVREAGADVQEIITLLDREEGAAENIKKENIKKENIEKENLKLTAIFRARDILSL